MMCKQLAAKVILIVILMINANVNGFKYRLEIEEQYVHIFYDSFRKIITLFKDSGDGEGEREFENCRYSNSFHTLDEPEEIEEPEKIIATTKSLLMIKGSDQPQKTIEKYNTTDLCDGYEKHFKNLFTVEFKNLSDIKPQPDNNFMNLMKYIGCNTDPEEKKYNFNFESDKNFELLTLRQTCHMLLWTQMLEQNCFQILLEIQWSACPAFPCRD